VVEGFLQFPPPCYLYQNGNCAVTTGIIGTSYYPILYDRTLELPDTADNNNNNNAPIFLIACPPTISVLAQAMALINPKTRHKFIQGPLRHGLV